MRRYLVGAVLEGSVVQSDALLFRFYDCSQIQIAFAIKYTKRLRRRRRAILTYINIIIATIIEILALVVALTCTPSDEAIARGGGAA